MNWTGLRPQDGDKEGDLETRAAQLATRVRAKTRTEGADIERRAASKFRATQR